MNMVITAEGIIRVAAVLAATGALAAFVRKIVHWVDEQRHQSVEIASVKEEQTLLTYGVLACLKGLSEQGCDGPVTEAIQKIEKHLNIQAHK